MKTIYWAFGCLALVSVAIANPTFTTQPVGGLVVQNSAIEIQFSGESNNPVTLSFPDGDPFVVLESSQRATEEGFENGVFSTKLTIRPSVAPASFTFRVSVTDSTGTTTSEPFTVVVVTQLLQNAEKFDNGYYEDSTLGFVFAGNPPFLYQIDGLGNFAVSNATSLNAWFYPTDYNFGWLYFDRLSYPWMYNTAENSWVYFVYQDGGRFFYIQRTDTWISR